jgi:hypothetical protein
LMTTNNSNKTFEVKPNLGSEQHRGFAVISAPRKWHY